MKRIIIFSLIINGLCACNSSQKTKEIDYTKYVNPFVGAADNGHCMPCACVPFGLIQAGPESGNCSWAYTAGYQYKDSILNGFSQTRLSGTGCPDLGDLLMLPFTGSALRSSYQSSYEKGNQKATPGYYSVFLSDFAVQAEMTATTHSAIHRYTFNNNQPPHLLIDFQSGMVSSEEQFSKHVIESKVNLENANTISGETRTNVWLDRTYFFVIEFNKPYTQKIVLDKRSSEENANRYVLDFDIQQGETLMVKIALSSTSIESAKRNLLAEIPTWEFEKVKVKARNEWNDHLSRIKVEGSIENKNIFYTSLYHLFIQPNNIADVDEEPFYSTLSLWDTYRAAHPLYTILSPERVNGFVNSMLHQFDLQGYLPIWALWGKETHCMIGNHAVPVIVDAYLKGFKGFDIDRAYLAVKTSLTESHLNSDWEVYDKYGYYPFDLIKVESVSRTLESCFDDYCAAQFAKALNKTEDYDFFMKRANYYKTLFDPISKLMRPKDSHGKWQTPFNKFVLSHASTSGGHYTEGNAWQYSWHVQHDVQGLIELMGGNDLFTIKLDSLYSIRSTQEGSGFVSDVTGLIGQYAQGNEPSHHVAYMYSLAGKPWRTQELINQILKTQYHDNVDGLCGNDDCGQMSAWYIFSSLGFYPLNPCGGEYVLGAPQLPEASIQLRNSKTFTIIADNYTPENIYVKSVTLNGEPYDKQVITHKTIIEGGVLRFLMSKTK